MCSLPSAGRPAAAIAEHRLDLRGEHRLALLRPRAAPTLRLPRGACRFRLLLASRRASAPPAASSRRCASRCAVPTAPPPPSCCRSPQLLWQARARRRVWRSRVRRRLGGRGRTADAPLLERLQDLTACQRSTFLRCCCTWKCCVVRLGGAVLHQNGSMRRNLRSGRLVQPIRFSARVPPCNQALCAELCSNALLEAPTIVNRPGGVQESSSTALGAPPPPRR